MVQAISRRRTRFAHGPSFLEFAWTSACNLRCVMCSQSTSPPVINIAKPRAAPLLDAVLPSVSIWAPSATSEPLLNDVDEIVRLCERHQVYLQIYTNTTLLDASRFEKLAPWIHKLFLSIDTHDGTTLTRLRPPLVLEEVRPNLRHATQRCRELAIPCSFSTVLMKDTVPTYPEFVDWVADLGGSAINVVDMLDNSPAAAAENAVATLGAERVAELLDAMSARARARGVRLTLELPAELRAGREVLSGVPERVQPAVVVEQLHEAMADESPGFCPQLGYYLKVEPDGEAFPCCRAPRELALGNVLDQELDAVWNGPAAQRLRRAHFENELPAPCRGCHVRARHMQPPA